MPYVQYSPWQRQVPPINRGLPQQPHIWQILAAQMQRGQVPPPPMALAPVAPPAHGLIAQANPWAAATAGRSGVPVTLARPQPSPAVAMSGPPRSFRRASASATVLDKQRPNERPIDYAARRVATAPARATAALGGAVYGAGAGAANWVAGEAKNLGRELFETPNQRSSRLYNSANMPKSFADPTWDRLEAEAAAQVGNPTLAPMLRALRTRGERSNSDQVNQRTGASTPYQITAQTRASIMKKHGFDPWSSPANAVRGAVIAATAYTGTGANFTDQNVAARAAGGYFGGGKGANNPFGSASDGNNTTAQYVSRVLGLAGNFGAPAPAFDPSPYQYAMGAQDAAAKILMSPTSTPFETAPVPDRPTPQEFQAPDFSVSDAAFAQTMPKDPFSDPKERFRMQKQGFLKGIGQGMASLSGTEGIGTILMKMGAGALAGRAQADERIDAKEELFEQRMQEYNLALANRESSKATTIANVLNQNIQQRNQFADQIWQDNRAKIEKYNPQFVDGKLITYTADPNDPTNPNKRVMTITPVDRAPEAAALINKASIGVSMGQASAAAGQFAYQSQQSAARTALGLAVSSAFQSGDVQSGAQGYATLGAMNARAAAQTGSWRSIFKDPNNADRLEAQARMATYQQLGIETKDGAPLVPPTGSAAAAFQQTFEDTLSGIIFNEAARLGQIERLVNNPTANAALVSQRAGSQKNSTRTDARGRTSYSSNWSLDE